MSELLSNHTSLHIGGPAKNFVRATTEEELVNAVKAADAAGEEVLIMGGGSNVLVADSGFSGTVIHVETKGNSYHVDACSGGMITVAAGEDWDGFVAWILEKGFAGLESKFPIHRKEITKEHINTALTAIINAAPFIFNIH